MKRKEINEIKKQFTAAGYTVTRIVGCVVSEEKEELYTFNRTFLSLEEEQMFKYFDMFRKGLSGRKGKNLYELEFLPDTGANVFLKTVRDSRLREETPYQILFKNIIDNYEMGGKYAIFIIHGAYDIPGKAKDGTTMEDASDGVYEYIMCCICPVTLSLPGLSWKEEIRTAERQWMIRTPETAFIYPAFTDRSEDYNHIWFYTKKANDPGEGLIENVLGCSIPVTPEEQREEFKNLTNAGELSIHEIEKVKELFRELGTIEDIQSETDEELKMEEIVNILKKAGIENAEGAAVDKVMLRNIINTKRFVLGTPDANVVVSAERTDLVGIREIDGKNYIVVETDGTVNANGIMLGGAGNEVD